MKNRRQILPLVAASAMATALALPAQSPAEYYVPPANSAANQYTESFPGAGGESGGKRKGATPGAALGPGNAKQLEKKGPAGKAAAEIAAETAPPQVVDSGSGGQADAEPSSGRGKDSNREGGSGGDESGSAGGGGTTGGSSGGGGGGSSGGNGGGAVVQQPQGSSGFGQVLGQATGADDGNLGLWLPLAIVLTLIGSVAYWARTRYAQPGHHA